MKHLMWVFLLAGCSDYSDRCKKIIDHTVEVGVRESTVGMSDEAVHKLVAQVESRRDDAMEKCEKGKPSQEDTDCALRGQSLAEINSCAWYRKAKVGDVR